MRQSNPDAGLAPVSEPEKAAPADPELAAVAAGLRYVSDDDVPGISRARCGTGFTYRHPDGTRIGDRQTLKRIRALAIPPAWTAVWISPFANSHLSATGRDAKNRKQYRYNPEFAAMRDKAKYERLMDFAASLPHIRKAVAAHMAMRGTPREKVLATIVSLLESTSIRVGNEDYAKANGSFGLTTLRNRHVRVTGSELRFLFQGKSGKTWNLTVNDRRVAKVIRACQELPGQQLFQYHDEAGAVQRVSSGDVNDYLRTVADRDVTAKDFRTWVGTVAAAVALQSLSGDGSGPLKKHIRAALERVAARLGNTVSICRKCYVHPRIISAYEAGMLALPAAGPRTDGFGLDAAEQAVLKLLKQTTKRGPARRTRAARPPLPHRPIAAADILTKTGREAA